MNTCVHTGGLVQRNKPSSDGGAEASGWGPPRSEKDLDLPDQESAGYDEDAEDSKALRLTLMEEVLLLGLKDREVCVCVCVCMLYMVKVQFGIYLLI